VDLVGHSFGCAKAKFPVIQDGLTQAGPDADTAWSLNVTQAGPETLAMDLIAV